MVDVRRLFMVPLLAFGLMLSLSLGAWAAGERRIVVFSKDTPFGTHAASVYVSSTEVEKGSNVNFVIQLLDSAGKVNIDDETVDVVVKSKIGRVGGNEFSKEYDVDHEGKIVGSVAYDSPGRDVLRFEFHYKCGDEGECEPSEPVAVVEIPVVVGGVVVSEAKLRRIENIYISGNHTVFNATADNLPGYFYNVKLGNCTSVNGTEVKAGDKFKVFVFGNVNANGTAEVAFLRIVDDKGNKVAYPTPEKTVEVNIENGKGEAEVELDKAGYYVVLAYVKGTSPVDSLNDACIYGGVKASDNATSYIGYDGGLTGGCVCSCENSEWCCLKDKADTAGVLHVTNAGFDHAEFVVDYPLVSNATVTYNATTLNGAMVPNLCIILYDKNGNVYRVSENKTYSVETTDGDKLATLVVPAGKYGVCTWNKDETVSINSTVLEGVEQIIAKSGDEKLELVIPGGAHADMMVVNSEPYYTSCNSTLTGNETLYVNYVLFYNGTSPVTNGTYNVTAGDNLFVFVGNSTGVPDDVSAHVYLYKYSDEIGCTNDLAAEYEIPQGDWESVTGGKVIKVQVKKVGKFCVAVQFELTKPRVGLCGVLNVKPSYIIGSATYVDLLGKPNVVWGCGNNKCDEGASSEFTIYAPRFKLEDTYGNVIVNGSLDNPVKITEVRIEGGTLGNGKNNDSNFAVSGLGYWWNSCNSSDDCWYNGNSTVTVKSVSGNNATLTFVLDKPSEEGRLTVTYVDVTINGTCGEFSVSEGCKEPSLELRGPKSIPPYGLGIYDIGFDEGCLSNCTLETNGMVLLYQGSEWSNFNEYATSLDSFNASGPLYVLAVGEEGKAQIWLKCGVVRSNPVEIEIKKVSHYAASVPTSHEVGFYEGDIVAAPVAYDDGKVNVNFNYAGLVDILVGVIGCDWEIKGWLGSDCVFHKDFTKAASQLSNISCSNVELPVDAGIVFWMVSGTPVEEITDWRNGPFIIKFYQFGTCE